MPLVSVTMYDCDCMYVNKEFIYLKNAFTYCKVSKAWYPVILCFPGGGSRPGELWDLLSSGYGEWRRLSPAHRAESCWWDHSRGPRRGEHGGADHCGSRPWGESRRDVLQRVRPCHWLQGVSCHKQSWLVTKVGLVKWLKDKVYVSLANKTCSILISFFISYFNHGLILLWF